MINEQAANAFKTAKTLTALYARLDVARDCITVALDNLPKDFDIHQIGRINDLRNILSREMAKIWDLRESEERRSCEQPPEPPKTPCKCAWCSRPAFKGWDSGKCPYCGCQETEPSPTPAEDQNRTLSGSHGDYSLPVMDIDVQIFPPDPTFIQVDNPGIPGL